MLAWLDRVPPPLFWTLIAVWVLACVALGTWGLRSALRKDRDESAQLWRPPDVSLSGPERDAFEWLVAGDLQDVFPDEP